MPQGILQAPNVCRPAADRVERLRALCCRAAQYELQPAQGQFNEAVFRGLDYALDQARAHGLKARNKTDICIQSW